MSTPGPVISNVRPIRIGNSTDENDVMAAKSFGTIMCGVFNIIAGQAAVGGGLLMALMFSGFGASTSEVMIPLALLVAGALFTLSGICLLLSSERVWRAALGLLALAIVFTLPWVFMVFEEGLGPDDDWMSVFFLWLPGLVALLALIEMFYLWQRGSAK